MAVVMTYEYLGVTAVAPGETVEIGWCLFRHEFPDPLINHTEGGEGDRILEIRRTVEHGEQPGQCRAFFYTVKNLHSLDWMVVGNNYIFFKY